MFGIALFLEKLRAGPRMKAMWQRELRVGLSLQLMAVWIVLNGPLAEALEFDMIFQTKCIMEEISSNVLVVAEYQAFLKTEPGKNVVVAVQVLHGHAPPVIYLSAGAGMAY